MNVCERGRTERYGLCSRRLYTWPFTRSSSGVGGERLARRVSGTDDLDEKTSVLSRLRSSSRSPRTINDPYTPSPCCETNGPFYFSFLFGVTARVTATLRPAVLRDSCLGQPRLDTPHAHQARLRQRSASRLSFRESSRRDPLNRESAKGAHNRHFPSPIRRMLRGACIISDRTNFR